jgi:hypothetical protein
MEIIGLNQTPYIKECVQKFCIDGMRPFNTAMDSGFIATITDDDTPLEQNVPYRSLISALLHIARMTRLDILLHFGITIQTFESTFQCCSSYFKLLGTHEF